MFKKNLERKREVDCEQIEADPNLLAATKIGDLRITVEEGIYQSDGKSQR
ncbi:hypothetical protein RMSM_06403 [Rhodopirellula maiorica SM1]|uniref:Uncharacterized protein n=1 Tax=Rhodopirellula maiorica SM1 TaxID=1265738 RepID=M5RRS5_9BACT|nr:hypothetical protein [Rhodopirellula maiorica]EMI16664.1 hypothetical protein RMSM_06403 [Rhodopirellula maiorica SM1]